METQLTDSLDDTGDEYLVASFAQQRLWFLAQLEGLSEAYHVPLGLRLRGQLDRTALQRALDRILSRHEVLRTTFVTIDGELHQRIRPAEDSSFTLLEHDLRPQPNAEGDLQHLTEHEVSAQFDLEHGPLIRGRLIRLSDDEHALLITMHHIVSDGWSMGILRNELSLLYAAFLRGEDDPIPTLPIQYADYAVWQREWLDGKRLEQQAEYWRGALADAPALLELPTDHSRPMQQDYTGAIAELELGESLTAGLRGLSRRHGCTMYMTLMAAWATLLGRLSGQTDIVIGTPVANRGRAEIENLIGFFASTLALRIDLSASPSVTLLLEHVKRQVLAAQQHQDIPFEQVVEIARPVRSLAHSPLFQVMFAWNNFAEEMPPLPGLDVHLLPSAQRMAKFDLTLSLREMDTKISGGIAYATALFEPRTIERYLGYFRRVLEGMVADDRLTVDRLPLLSASERNQLLYAWNATQAVSPVDRCVHELFEVQAAKTPDVIALVFEGRQLSYTELNARANQLAHHLIATGLKPEGRVAIALERSAEMVVAMLAILKAGGAFVPIDPAYPAERISFMIEDSAPDILLTQRAVLPLLGQLPDKLPILTLNDSTPPWAALPATNPDPASIGLTSANLAYVIYTSGSTGRPKGVLIEHGPLAQHCAECQEFYGLTQEDRVLQFASPSFDAALEQILPPLLSGARVVLRDVQLWTSSEFQQKLGELGLTVINLPPAVWQQLAEQWVNAVEPVSVQAVRLVIIGGDAMSVQTLRLWQQTAFNSVRLLNAYGPTETVITATSFEIPPSVSGQARFERLPIGRKRGARRLYVRDRWGQLAPVGVAGELLIGGTALARGYHNRADLTAEKFIADPFSNDAGDRVYRTGDLARYLPDGNIEFLGRVDQQVKIRGFRIELGEIEARLQEHAAIRDAVVLLREDVAGDKRLVAYYVALTHEDIDQEKLRSYLAAGLPEYMVPAAYVRLDGLPLTTNGKLDRKALPAPDDDAYARAAFEAPQGEIETALAAIWAEMLGLERISRNDDFFNLGGHSLLALRVISEINKTLKLHLSVPAFFLNPTIERLARELDHSHYVRTEPRVVMLRKGHAGLPVYLMGGRPDEYQLGQLIAGDRSVFATDVPIQTEWLSALQTSDKEKLPTVEQLGALYGELLAAHAGSSPCVIAGYSLGGKIAFEAARVLQRAGGNVAFVLLLDAQAFTWRRFILGPALESFFWIWRETAARKVDGAPLMERLSASLGDTWTIIRFLLLRVPAAMWNRFGAIMARFGKVTNRFSPTSNPSDTLSGYFDNEGRPIAMLDLHVLGQAMGRLWRPRPLDAAGVLIRAHNFADMLPGYKLTNGWDNLFARGLEVVRTTGDHISMLSDEHTPVLARQMNLILDRYEAARAETTDAPGNNMDHRGTDGQRRFEQASSQPEPTDA